MKTLSRLIAAQMRFMTYPRLLMLYLILAIIQLSTMKGETPPTPAPATPIVETIRGWVDGGWIIIVTGPRR